MWHLKGTRTPECTTQDRHTVIRGFLVILFNMMGLLLEHLWWYYYGTIVQIVDVLLDDVRLPLRLSWPDSNTLWFIETVITHKHTLAQTHRNTNTHTCVFVNICSICSSCLRLIGSLDKFDPLSSVYQLDNSVMNENIIKHRLDEDEDVDEDEPTQCSVCVFFLQQSSRASSRRRVSTDHQRTSGSVRHRWDLVPQVSIGCLLNESQ